VQLPASVLLTRLIVVPHWSPLFCAVALADLQAPGQQQCPTSLGLLRLHAFRLCFVRLSLSFDWICLD
jgi:hypothetical protein